MSGGPGLSKLTEEQWRVALKAYVERTEPANKIAARYGISSAALCQMAKRRGLTRTRPPLYSPGARRVLEALQAGSNTRADLKALFGGNSCNVQVSHALAELRDIGFRIECRAERYLILSSPDQEARAA